MLPRQPSTKLFRLKLNFCRLVHTESLPITKQDLKTLLQRCSSHPNQLKQLHAIILTTGLSIKNALITQLLTSLTLLGDMSYVRQLFDEMHKPRPFLWNTMMKGYVRNGIPDEAVSVYGKMHHLGVRPDPFTFPFVIKACTELGELWTGLGVHGHVLKHGLEFFAVVRTELMIMYAKFGELVCAEFLFVSMVERDLVAWNALIIVCVQTGFSIKALQLFREMGMAGMMPDSVTIVGALSACGHLGCLETGEEIYEFARKEGLDGNIIVHNARLDMYTKCGDMDKAMDLFDQMPQRNVISWSTMIGGYAMNGECEKTLALFSRMKNQGVEPNHVTYLGVLSACTHSGRVNEGWQFFNFMVKSDDKHIQPRKEHYACMADLLGRSGHLQEAYYFITSMPIEADPGIWGALLGACAIHKSIRLGQHVADLLFELAPEIASYHVLMSNMYATAGRWHCVEKVRQRMKKKGARKVAGYSSVEFNGEIHVFYKGDKSHPQSAGILVKLEDLLNQMKGLGYIPDTDSMLHDVEDEEKEYALSTHSEKLAIAFGLINGNPKFPIRVMKNLRICGDCHAFCKFVSRITMREIVMRDKNRFHHFKNGVCSCKDYW